MPQQWDLADIAALHAEAVEVLSTAGQWRLAEARWQMIERVLAAMEAALANGDSGRLAEEIAALERAGPLRIIPIDSAIGPTPVVHDLLNKLVHSLGGISVGNRVDEPEDARAGNADTSRS